MSTDLPRLPARDPGAHKGTLGTVAVIGGCARGATRMIGAPALAAIGALRAGAGLAKIGAPDPIIDAVLVIAPSATGRAMPVDHEGALIPHEAAAAVDALAAGAACLAIGPGLGQGAGVEAAVLRAVQQEDTPVIVDADGINALARIPQVALDLRAAAVLTPHPGEFARLCEGLGLKDHLGLPRSREKAAEALAQRLACIVVLKGKGTVVSDGTRTWTCSSGHPCLATAGTGDVLTGVMAGVIAQFVAPLPVMAIPGMKTATREKPLDLFDAARAAVSTHAIAGERWASTWKASGGLTAMDLAAEVPAVIESLRGT